MYYERMNSYYPQVIQSILEFQSIIQTESTEIETFAENREKTLNDAYLTTMSEERLIQWEKVLNIQPIPGSSVEDRRDTVIARIRGQGKLNTTLINSIVNAFTGGSAESWIEDGVLYVVVTPPPNNKQYQFANVEQELKKKVPAHLSLQVNRNYNTWDVVTKNNTTWQSVKDSYETWEDIYLFVPFKSYSLRR